MDKDIAMPLQCYAIAMLVFAISSPVSFSGIVKMLWEAYLTLEDIDLCKVLAASEETSLMLKGMGWGDGTPVQWQEASEVRGGGGTKGKAVLPWTRS